MQRTIEAVIFDNDGTLVDSENITLSVLMEIAIEHGADVRDDDPHRFLGAHLQVCLLYTSPSPRDRQKSRMPSSA